MRPVILIYERVNTFPIHPEPPTNLVVSQNILDPNSQLVDVTLDNDRTYYNTNQNYENINNEIKIIITTPDNKQNDIALFVGEGNIFTLLPTLAEYVSQVIVIDKDNKLIEYKRKELEAFTKSNNKEDYYLSLLDYAKTKIPDLNNVKETDGLHSIKVRYEIRDITDEKFTEIKETIGKIDVTFLQIDVMKKNDMQKFSDQLKKASKKIKILNRTNLMEYGTPHMQKKFFEKTIPELNHILDNFTLLPIDENAIILFGVSNLLGENTYVDQGWQKSIETEKNMISINKKFFDSS